MNTKILSLICMVILLLPACKKDYGSSKATFWPDIQINGSEIIIVPIDSVYNDESAVVTANGADIPFETTSNVDVSEYGVYNVVYLAINDDGISATKSRTVVVVDRAAADDDLSGSYQRGSGTPMSAWAKDPSQEFRYLANNPGGVGSNPPFDVPFQVWNVAPGLVVVPLQQSGALAPFYATAGSVEGDPLIPFNVSASVGQVAYTWYMNGPNFGAAARVFVKRQ